MHKKNKSVGDYGENLAKEYLENIGYIIWDKNFKCKTGEIDIIAQKSRTIAFIEVKSRYNNFYGNPCEAVNFIKKAKIYKAAKFYIFKNKLNGFDFRFDVIEVIFNYNNNNNYINHIENAFQI